MAGTIRVGVGGWTFAPWRGRFYPEDLTQKRELEYASRALTSIEINGTFYGSQKPESFAKWREETPEGFVFSLKGPRYATNRKVLAEAGESIERFVNGGIVKLEDRLGPINWQLAATKQFDAEDFEAFLKLLPKSVEGIALRHVVEARHPSFAVPEAIALMRRHGVGLVVAGDSDYPLIPDLTADFVYLRIMGAREEVPGGYDADEVSRWAERVRAYAEGRVPDGFEAIAPEGAEAGPRDVFVYFISGFKPANPDAARALIAALG
ncbi:DUF72 domain-containing protein [Arsenicitalea aurantiaca]|uniref:DUF72 domain-containing protein n=1 Tax=Arsenicitalea aurantiaca TaxID=1783274 RepID=A0A433XKP1_9HYPH|nr:DUF72 domain-containing protein [Arsenicitalea aurantiaca]RUT34584.1 DUF72 domain-containing protein [Arsenicitalea aurantiaca]